jgi:hypothetical protein
MRLQVSTIFKVFLDWLDIIEGFLKMSKPMAELLEKDKTFKWMRVCEASFQELKKQLMTAPLLVMPDMNKPFSIYCDVSGQALGCVLMQMVMW